MSVWQVSCRGRPFKTEDNVRVSMRHQAASEGVDVVQPAGWYLTAAGVQRADALCSRQTRLHEAALACADRLECTSVLLLDQDAVVLLVLRAPYLQHRHCLIAQLDLHGMAMVQRRQQDCSR